VAVIVNTLNAALRGADPLSETIDAKFTVTDVGFNNLGQPPVPFAIHIHVECEWVSRPSCTLERAFVELVHVFEREGVRKKVMEQIPDTVRILQVKAFDHLKLIGVAEVAWDDLLAFANNEITGEQLATRLTRSDNP
jgi:hypothetical protein